MLLLVAVSKPSHVALAWRWLLLSLLLLTASCLHLRALPCCCCKSALHCCSASPTRMLLAFECWELV